MLAPKAPAVLETAGPDEEITLILSFAGRPDLRGLAKVRDTSVRRRAVGEFYAALKEPCLCALRLMAGEGVRIVSELSGSHQAIAAAPAAVWIRAFGDASSPLAATGVVAVPNGPAS